MRLFCSSEHINLHIRNSTYQTTTNYEVCSYLKEQPPLNHYP
jgi:hypothetical protein